MLLNDTKAFLSKYKNLQSVDLEHFGSTKKGSGTKENIRE